jgi:hypothetical protein
MRLVENNGILPLGRTDLICLHQDPFLLEVNHIDVGGERINIELRLIATPENQSAIVYRRLHLPTKVITIFSVIRECGMPFAILPFSNLIRCGHNVVLA